MRVRGKEIEVEETDDARQGDVVEDSPPVTAAAASTRRAEIRQRVAWNDVCSSSNDDVATPSNTSGHCMLLDVSDAEAQEKELSMAERDRLIKPLRSALGRCVCVRVRGRQSDIKQRESKRAREREKRARERERATDRLK